MKRLLIISKVLLFSGCCFLVLTAMSEGGGCSQEYYAKPDYVRINDDPSNFIPRKMVIFPFMTEKKMEALIVLRDDLQPYLYKSIKDNLVINDFIEPETVGSRSIKTGIKFSEMADEILEIYSAQSVVDTEKLEGLLKKIDPDADSILFIQVSQSQDNSSNQNAGNATLNMHGYMFVKGFIKARWLGQHFAYGDDTSQEGYKTLGMNTLDMFIHSMPFQK